MRLPFLVDERGLLITIVLESGRRPGFQLQVVKRVRFRFLSYAVCERMHRNVLVRYYREY